LANQRGVLRVQRVLDAAQHVIELRGVHFEDLRGVSHPTPTSSPLTPHRPFAGGRASPPRRAGLFLPYWLMEGGGQRFGKSRFRYESMAAGNLRGPTGRQSGAAPFCVGWPAESNTASWWAARRPAPLAEAAAGHQGKRPCESRL